MAWPTTPSEGDEYTNPLGTVWRYDSTAASWDIVSQEITGAQGVTGIQGTTGAAGTSVTFRYFWV